MTGVIKDSERIPPHPPRTKTERSRQLCFAGIATAVLAVLGGVGYGSYEFAKDKTQQETEKTEKAERDSNEQHEEKLRVLKTINVNVTTKLENQKLELTQFKGKISAQVKDENDQEQTWWLSIIEEPKIGETFSIGLDEYEAPVQFKTLIDDVTVTYSAKAWASKKEESSYVLTFNQQ